VTNEARAAFEAARALDPKAPEPRFFLGLAAEQEGRKDAAKATWQALLADTPADAPWRPMVAMALTRVDPNAKPPAAAGAATGPTADQMAAAADLSDTQRIAMINGMVSQLAARLKDQPNDPEGWLRLIRSYAVLGRKDDAAAAAGTALASVTDASGRSRIEALVAELGVTPPKVGEP
jgi:cytochrome c-type biogenesis protein CcmH